METCDPLEHPAASVRRNNIVRLARRGGTRENSSHSLVSEPLGGCLTKPPLPNAKSDDDEKHSPHASCLSLGGENELQQLARVARMDVDAACRAAAVGAMVAIRSAFSFALSLSVLKSLSSPSDALSALL